MAVTPGDEWVERLTHLFREHPAWVEAARHIDRRSMSTVYFSQLGPTPWHLEQAKDGARLLAGAASDPDFVFRFSPESIERLEDVEGGVGEFSVALFSLVVDDRVQLRIVAGFARLARRGYVKLLLLAGPPLLAFGAQHGVRTLGALRRLVAQLRAREPEDWEA